MVTRILLLASLAWIAHLTRGLFTVAGHEVTARDLVLLGGGLFLLAKATFEIHHNLEGEEEHDGAKKAASFAAVIAQIMVLDIIFSLDSVITAIGMADHLPVMIAAVVIAVLVMMAAAGSISRFVEGHPTVKMLALSFLLLVGMSLIAEGFGQHISKALHLLRDGLLGLRRDAQPEDPRAGGPAPGEVARLGAHRGRIGQIGDWRAIRSCRPSTRKAPGKAASRGSSTARPPSAMRVPAARAASASSPAPAVASAAASGRGDAQPEESRPQVRHRRGDGRGGQAAAEVHRAPARVAQRDLHQRVRHGVGIAGEGAADGQWRVVPATRQGSPQVVQQPHHDLARAPFLVHRQGAVLPALAEVRERASDHLVADLGDRSARTRRG